MSKIFEHYIKTYGGERGIRTPGPVTVNGFQDRRFRPLSHLSERGLIITAFLQIERGVFVFLEKF